MARGSTTTHRRKKKHSRESTADDCGFSIISPDLKRNRPTPPSVLGFDPSQIFVKQEPVSPHNDRSEKLASCCEEEPTSLHKQRFDQQTTLRALHADPVLSA